MSFSLANGFSDGALTPTRALAAGLFIAGAVIVGMWTYGSVARWLERDPTVAPACYGAERTSHTPGNKPVPGNPANPDERLWWNPRGGHYVERVVAAEFICTAQSCDRQAFEQYRSALFWYLSERMRRTRQLDANYGDKGLERARLLFGGKVRPRHRARPSRALQRRRFPHQELQPEQGRRHDPAAGRRQGVAAVPRGAALTTIVNPDECVALRATSALFDHPRRARNRRSHERRTVNARRD